MNGPADPLALCNFDAEQGKLPQAPFVVVKAI